MSAGTQPTTGGVEMEPDYDHPDNFPGQTGCDWDPNYEGDDYWEGYNQGHTDGMQAQRRLVATQTPVALIRATMTENTKYGPALWLDGRFVARVGSDIANSRITEDDPEPQWRKDALTFVHAVNDTRLSATQTPVALDELWLSTVLHARYGDDFPDRPNSDWRSDAEWIAARLAATEEAEVKE